MESTRLNKVSRLIQKELSDFFLKESRTKFLGSIISVTTLRISADLSLAHAYISIFPPDKRDEIFEAVSKNASQIKHELAKRTRHQLRKVPSIEFHIDDSLDYVEKIDELLKK